MTVQQPRRTGVPDDLRDLYKRVRILEALNNGLGSSGRTFETCSDFILAQPTLFSFWPMNDAGGGAVDVHGGRDLAEFAKEGFPVYGQPGPYTGIPADTSIENDGDGGVIQDDHQRLEAAITSGDAAAIFSGTHAFTIEFWVYPIDYTADNMNPLFIWNGVGTEFLQFTLLTSGRMKFERGTGLVGGTAAEACPLLTWTQARATYDGTSLRMYINRVLTSTSASAFSVTAGATTVTAMNNQGAGSTNYRPLNGRMANLAFYTSAVSTFCDPQGGGGGPCMGEGYSPVTDDDCGWSWQYPLKVTY